MLVHDEFGINVLVHDEFGIDVLVFAGSLSQVSTEKNNRFRKEHKLMIPIYCNDFYSTVFIKPKA